MTLGRREGVAYKNHIRQSRRTNITAFIGQLYLDEVFKP